MRTVIAVVAALIIALVLADRVGVQRILTGTVGEYVAGERISITNEATDPMGVHIALHNDTAFEGDPALIRPGVRVVIWYRSAGERWPLADKVRVLPDEAPH